MSKESERVVFHEVRGNEKGPMRFQRVDVNYADGALFYSGWIQDFGDGRNGPTVFPQNYAAFGLDQEEVHRRDIYWDPKTVDPKKVVLREATEEDFDGIIDLNFQNYYDGDYNRISAYQGLNYAIDKDNCILVAEIDDVIYGFLCINWISNASVGAAYFDSLYCAVAVRNNGIGHRLIAAGVKLAQEKDFEEISGKINGGEEHCVQIVKMLNKHRFEVIKGIEPRPGYFEVEVLRRSDGMIRGDR